MRNVAVCTQESPCNLCALCIVGLVPGKVFSCGRPGGGTRRPKPWTAACFLNGLAPPGTRVFWWPDFGGIAGEPLGLMHARLPGTHTQARAATTQATTACVRRTLHAAPAGDRYAPALHCRPPPPPSHTPPHLLALLPTRTPETETPATWCSEGRRRRQRDHPAGPAACVPAASPGPRAGLRGAPPRNASPGRGQDGTHRRVGPSNPACSGSGPSRLACRRRRRPPMSCEHRTCKGAGCPRSGLGVVVVVPCRRRAVGRAELGPGHWAAPPWGGPVTPTCAACPPAPHVPRSTNKGKFVEGDLTISREGMQINSPSTLGTRPGSAK